MKRKVDLDTLINHMNKRGIIVSNHDEAKRTLLLTGYFHGYKECQFIVSKNDHGLNINHLNPIHFKRFSQLEALYRINNELNDFFYPIITQVITALKSHIAYFLANHGGMYLDDMYWNCMKNKINCVSLGKRCSSRYIFKELRRLFRSNLPYNLLIKRQYRGKEKKLYQKAPIWIMFEMITVWQLKGLCGCLNNRKERQLERDLGMVDRRYDVQGGFLSKHLGILINLRDAVAHNKVIFDGRFRGNDGIRGSIVKKLQQDSHVKPIEFNNVVDYFILLAYYQNLLNVKESGIRDEASHLEKVLHNFKNHFSHHLYYAAFGRRPLLKLKRFYFN